MREERNANYSQLGKYRDDFKHTMQAIYDTIGKNAFRNFNKGKYSTKFNPALFDAVSVSFFKKMRETEKPLVSSEEQHKLLFENDEFVKACKQRTTDISNILKRINLAEQILFEGETDETRAPRYDK